jgi:hypothetical protein
MNSMFLALNWAPTIFAELDGVCLVENESVTVDDGDLLGPVRIECDERIDIMIMRGGPSPDTGLSVLPDSSEQR